MFTKYLKPILKNRSIPPYWIWSQTGNEAHYDIVHKPFSLTAILRKLWKFQDGVTLVSDNTEYKMYY